jgi:hypothetical protein
MTSAKYQMIRHLEPHGVYESVGLTNSTPFVESILYAFSDDMAISMEKKKKARRDESEKIEISPIVKHLERQSVTVTSSIPPELLPSEKEKRSRRKRDEE